MQCHLQLHFLAKQLLTFNTSAIILLLQNIFLMLLEKVYHMKVQYCITFVYLLVQQQALDIFLQQCPYRDSMVPV